MRKILVILAALAFLATIGAEGFASQSNVGCGVGNMIFKGKSGLMSQTLAITTNHIFLNQSFGITSGTLGCSQFSGLASNEKINKYVADNMDNLAKDIAKGNGEYLTTLAVIIEVPEKDRAQFYNKLQSNFSKIYSSKKVTHIDVLKGIDMVLKKS